VKGRNPPSTHELNRGLTLALNALVTLEVSTPTRLWLTQSNDIVLEAPWIVRIACVVAVAVNAVGDGLTTTDASAADAVVRPPIAIAPTAASFLNFADILSSPGIGFYERLSPGGVFFGHVNLLVSWNALPRATD
jgi:hypothetical protein